MIVWVAAYAIFAAVWTYLLCQTVYALRASGVRTTTSLLAVLLMGAFWPLSFAYGMLFRRGS